MTRAGRIRTVTGMTTTTEAMDPAAVEAFAGRIFGLLTDGMLVYMVDVGHRTGLFDAMAEGPGTSDEIADRAGLNERYVREWLGAVVTGGIVEYEAATATYRLPPVAAACLAGTGPTNMAPFTRMSTLLGNYVEPVAVAFREGGGVPYAEYIPEFTGVMDALGRGVYDGLL